MPSASAPPAESCEARGLFSSLMQADFERHVVKGEKLLKGMA
jgi:hypothetical protein